MLFNINLGIRGTRNVLFHKIGHKGSMLCVIQHKFGHKAQGIHTMCYSTEI